MSLAQRGPSVAERGHVSVRPVLTARDRRAFIDLPHRLYAGDPNWVPPLSRDIQGFLDSPRHPIAADADLAFFLAERDQRIVGRIGVCHNHAHLRHHQDGAGFFGFFEVEDDPHVSAALLERARQWLRERGLTVLRGPCSPSTNYECGLFIEGDPGPPVLMMAYNPAYYARHLEGFGLSKAQDLLAYVLEREHTDVARWDRLAERVATRTGATIRRLDFSRFAEEVRLINLLYQDAWGDNWGFVPMNQAEMDRMAKELRPLVLGWATTFITLNGEDVGFRLSLPDYNRVLIRLRGRLFPFGFLRVLWAKSRIPFHRCLLMGIAKQYRHLGLDALLYRDITEQSFQHGVPASEASWLLESNQAMVNTAQRAGGRLSRRYRIYEMPI